MGGMLRRKLGVHRTGANHNRHTGVDQTLNPFHPLCIGQERPIAH